MTLEGAVNIQKMNNVRSQRQDGRKLMNLDNQSEILAD